MRTKQPYSIPKLFALITAIFSFWSDLETKFPEQKDTVPMMHIIKLWSANSETFSSGSDPYDFFDQMKVDDDASHAFYLGIELARAQIAFQLGKDYDQDNELNWGIAVKKKKQNLLKRPDLKVTQK